MSAKMIINKAFFKIKTENENPESIETATDKAMQMVLNTLETAITMLINQGNDAALQALQTCTGELFRRAAECRQQGKKMEVEE